MVRTHALYFYGVENYELFYVPVLLVLYLIRFWKGAMTRHGPLS